MPCSAAVCGRAPASQLAAHASRQPRRGVTGSTRRASLTVSNAVVGIDLGTSNTAMACVFDGTARVLRVQDSASVPSLVAIAQVG